MTGRPVRHYFLNTFFESAKQMALARAASTEPAPGQRMGYSLDHDSKTSGNVQLIGDQILRVLKL